MAKRASGGARDVERKHRTRSAKRPKNYNATARRAIQATWNKDGSALGAIVESVAELRLLARQAATDPGMPPEYRREQAGRLRAALVKAADPAQLIQELGAELRAALATIESLEAKLRAARSAPAGTSGDPAPQLQ